MPPQVVLPWHLLPSRRVVWYSKARAIDLIAQLMDNLRRVFNGSTDRLQAQISEPDCPSELKSWTITHCPSAGSSRFTMDNIGAQQVTATSNSTAQRSSRIPVSQAWPRRSCTDAHSLFWALCKLFCGHLWSKWELKKKRSKLSKRLAIFRQCMAIVGGGHVNVLISISFVSSMWLHTVTSSGGIGSVIKTKKCDFQDQRGRRVRKR